MGLTDQRKTAKNIKKADYWQNEKKITAYRQQKY